MRASLFVRAFAAATFALCVACGSDAGTALLDLQVLTPTDVDPFAGAVSVTVTAGSTSISITPAADGTFSAFSMDQVLDSTDAPGPITLTVLDADNTVIAYGATPSLAFYPLDKPLRIWVDRVSTSSLVPGVTLSSPRSASGIGTFDSYGPIIAGGREPEGAQAADLYEAFFHDVVPAGTGLTVARALPLVAPLAQSATVEVAGLMLAFGETGLATTPTGILSPEVYDPLAEDANSSSGLFCAATNVLDMDLARDFAGQAALPDGTMMLVGGSVQGVARRDVLNIAATDSTLATCPMGAGAGVSSNDATMLGADRIGPAVVGLMGGDVLVLGGGNDQAAPGEHLEFVRNTSTPMVGDSYPITRPAAALVTGNRVFAAGGRDANGQPTADVAIAELGTGANGTYTLTVTHNALFTPRADATVTVIDDTQTTVFIAGGVGADGIPIATAEIFSVAGTPVLMGKPIMLGQARTQHVAARLATGNILLAGGLTTSGVGNTPTDSIELYTPPAPTQ